MEANIKIEILKSIGNVYDASKDSKLNDELFENLKVDLKILSDYFRISDKQAFFLSQIYALNYKGDTVDMNDLISYFDCNPMKILVYSDDLEFLYKNGYLRKMKSNHHIKISFTNDQFIVNEKITEAVLNNQPMPDLNKNDFDSLIDLLEKLYDLGCERENKEISTRELFRYSGQIIKQNRKYKMLKHIYNLKMEPVESYLVLYMAWKTLLGYEKVCLESIIDGIYDRSTERVKCIQKLLNRESALFKENLIDLEESGFISDAEIRLSDTALDLLKAEGLKIMAKKRKRNNIIEPEKIKAKELFFNNEEFNQIEMLGKLLQDEKLKEIQSRLTDKNLPKGVAILLYGSPGTGKTETVYQMAKETNREIMKVEISQSKSMWFGESEKIIKRIFTDYKEYASKCEKIPILLFNEADAIISKRRDIGASNVAQTENAIQNIILEELENFEGIFFATTNLAKNIDSAFERRFLFKIEFQKPETGVKARIWKSKLTSLSDQTCEVLARNYDFSGGQIDNIVRKVEMHEIINGSTPEIHEIIAFCDAEILLKKDWKSVGFRK